MRMIGLTLIGLGKRGILTAGALAAFVVAQPSSLQAQAPTAKIHGHVTNPAGMAFNVKGAAVQLTTDKTSAPKDRKYPFSFPIDANGDFKGEGIAPGDYIVIVAGDGKSVDFQDATLKGGDDKTLDFDMTRAEYIKTLTPEEKAALEEYKKKTASVSADNAKIANINKTLLQARTDEKAGKADDAVNSLKPLTALKPDEPILWASLGEAQLALGDQQRKAAVAAKTSPADPAILQSYSDAADSYKKAVELNAAAKKPAPENLAGYYLNEGQALAKSGHLPEAADAYEASAKANPASAGSAYFNEAAVFFNAQKLPEAGAAADKAIAADPKRAEPYYIKGQALIPGATVDAKTGKYVLPPGCLEAYQEYLELAPTGQYAGEVKALLDGLGQPIKSSFKAGKK